MLALAVVIISVGIVAGVIKHDFMWFARSGALVVAVGIALLSRSSVAGLEPKFRVKMDETGLSMIDHEYWKKRNQEVPQWVLDDEKMRFAVGVLGPAVSLLGTIIWGFGDLLNAVISPAAH